MQAHRLPHRAASYQHAWARHAWPRPRGIRQHAAPRLATALLSLTHGGLQVQRHRSSQRRATSHRGCASVHILHTAADCCGCYTVSGVQGRLHYRVSSTPHHAPSTHTSPLLSYAQLLSCRTGVRNGAYPPVGVYVKQAVIQK